VSNVSTLLPTEALSLTAESLLGAWRMLLDQISATRAAPNEDDMALWPCAARLRTTASAKRADAAHQAQAWVTSSTPLPTTRPA
jgi:hypothetical protein